MGGFAGFCYRQLTYKPKPLPSTVSCYGKTVLITGGNSGLGLEAARELATHDITRIILATRDAEKAEAAKSSILANCAGTEIQIWPLDHDSYESIASFSQRLQDLDRLDYALLNAGVKKVHYTPSHAGHEMNVQINHIATSAVSFAVLRALRKTAEQFNTPGRLTIVSSEGHFWIPFKERHAENILKRMDDKATFGSQMDRYYTSKLLNVLWARSLAEKVPASEVIINTVNPGFCYSGLHRDQTSSFIKVFLWVFGWTSTQGGYCLVDALVQHGESHGRYLSEQKETRPSPYVLSEEGEKDAQRIWEETTALLHKEAASVDMSPLV